MKLSALIAQGVGILFSFPFCSPVKVAGLTFAYPSMLQHLKVTQADHILECFKPLCFHSHLGTGFFTCDFW
jgi:hypothetical protein